MTDHKKIYNYFKQFLKGNLFSAIGPIFLFLFGNILIGNIAPLYYKKIVNIATEQVSSGIYNFTDLSHIMMYISVFIFFGYILYRLGSHFMQNFENKMITLIHQHSFDLVKDQSHDFFASNFIGTLTGKVSRLAKNFREFYSTLTFGFFMLFVDMIVTIGILFTQNSLLALLFFFFIVSFIFLSILFMKNQAKYDKLRVEKSSIRMGVISDILTNIFNIKIFSAENKESYFYRESLLELDIARINTWRYLNRVRIYKSIFFFIFEISAMWLTLYLFTQGVVTLGVFVLVQAYLANIIRSSWSLDRNITGFIETYSDASDAIGIVTQEKDIKDIKNPEIVKMNIGEINYKNISFTYPGGDHVFDEFNLHIPAGQSIGIVGKSGSGKTTLTKLLLRFYDVDSGQITIDNQNITSVTQNDLRSSIAYIPQETILFHRSIYENVSYGDFTANKNEVIQASISAHVDEFVQNLEQKYETKVGERGIKLSGGQRQRIGIARAMLRKNAPILMLDEATSSLDSMSEKYIQDSFEKLSENRTTIVIAHRLSTIQKLDRIVVMEKGKIIEDGPHDVLIKNNGHYASLWNSQVNGFISDEIE